MVLNSNPVVIRHHPPPLPHTNGNVFFEPFVWGEGCTGILCSFPVGCGCGCGCGFKKILSAGAGAGAVQKGKMGAGAGAVIK